MSRRSVAFALPCLLAIAASVGALYLLRDFWVEDSYIPFRYVALWLRGDGLAWNPGEHVEGYSSFLFLLLLGSLRSLTMDFFLAARLINAVSFFGLAILLARYLRQQSPIPDAASWLSSVGVMLLITSVPCLFWLQGGLETGLFAALMGISLMLLLQRLEGARTSHAHALLTGLCFALLCLTRPEGLLVAGLAFAALLLQHPTRDWRAFLAFALPVVAHLLWRHHYYGAWLPNTYYVKLGAAPSLAQWHDGLLYLWHCLLCPPFFAFYLPVLFYAARSDAARRRGNALLVIITLSYALYIASTGGDWMPAQRFFVPLIPLLVLLTARLLAPHAATLAAHRYAPLLLWLICVLCLMQGSRFLRERERDLMQGSFTDIAQHIVTHWPKNSLIGINLAGFVPTATLDHRYLDMLGLNDATIAHRTMTPSRMAHMPGHAKGDGAYVLARAPDYIIAGAAIHGSRVEDAAFVTEQELAANPRFPCLYALRTDTLPTPHVRGIQSMQLLYYQRRATPESSCLRHAR